jgi:hypothetical protein
LLKWGVIIARDVQTDFRKNKYQSKKSQLFSTKKCKTRHTPPQGAGARIRGSKKGVRRSQFLYFTAVFCNFAQSPNPADKPLSRRHITFAP